ncbi:DUF5602 domain-containing protein [Hymenobacter glacialis]|uniref:TTHB210-like domain-containing protein n=1 Tax=Hymenobacter glacialis TaxID=1908236 RepID=A0A1G1TAF4_9BACT|nr:DUF5602 domain-containing protein [Hymenobacter glacialis]OGX87850.1 hypothetical protein BEN48_11035 [Hymenobacter glacialis]
MPAILSGLLLACIALVGPACSKQDAVEPVLSSSSQGEAKADKTKTFYGPAKPMGQGVGRAWVEVGSNGKPLAIGIDLSAKSMLSQGSSPTEYTLQLPHQVAVPPFDHIELGWNPQGHEPDHIYTLPHFDVHFYMISSAFQATIPFLAPPAFDTQPAAKYLPADYLMGPGLVPNMGAHAVDLRSDEFQPDGVFTKTFIYGSYQGRLTFLEPMFTLKYLEEMKSETIEIRQPQAFARAGYYPTTYTISYTSSPKEYHISLNKFIYHEAE